MRRHTLYALRDRRSRLLLLPALSVRSANGVCSRRISSVSKQNSLIFQASKTEDIQHCRCARNCFLCPQCTHTLVVTASDPAGAPDLHTPASSIGEPPFYLACTFCRWDSKEVGISFEKPTGLARMLTRRDDSAGVVDHVFDCQCNYKSWKRRRQPTLSSITLKNTSNPSFELV